MDLNTRILYLGETDKISSIEVGKPYPALIGKGEGLMFDLTDCGSILACMLSNPTDYEKQQFNTGKQFEMRYIRIKDIIFIIAKIGGLTWFDAPFTPHLCQCLTNNIILPTEGDGLMLTLHLINSAYGKALVESIRVIGLSSWFTKELLKDVMDISNKPFDLSEYLHNIKNVYAKYSSKDLAKMATIYTKL